jgi:hypothetical protein
MVLRSTANDISTVAEAEANGVLVQDWTRDIASAEATGLSASTQYYFNVLVKDGEGNIAAYVSSSAMTAALPAGSLSLSITVTSPQDRTFVFNESNDQVFAPDSWFEVTLMEPYSSILWMLDGVVRTDFMGDHATIWCSTLTLGVHHLTLFVRFSEPPDWNPSPYWYSKTFRFRIEN